MVPIPLQQKSVAMLTPLQTFLRLALLAAPIASALVAPAGAAPTYRWSNVRVGGGGFSPGIVFSPVERDLAYLRTDIGGLYRWDKGTQRWLPLQDAMPQSNYFGIESVAPDPVDANVVYAAAGMYRREAAAILRSTNRGNRWQVYPVSFRMGGNEDGRGLGERLAVDPQSTRVLYFGSRHDGLQRSTDHGATWRAVSSFPAHGFGLQRNGQNAGPTHAGISFVVIDPRRKLHGASQTLFVGVADPGAHHLYRSNDAGASWFSVPNEPPPDLLPAQAQLDSRGDLYITYVSSIGPNGIERGAVYRLSVDSDRWTDITPDKSLQPPAGGYMGLSVDRQRPGTLLVATVNRWTSGDTVWRSTDAGATWRSLKEISTREVSATPYLRWGNAHAEFGHWMAGVAIDPFNSNHAAYTTGATLYETLSLSADAAAANIAWRPWVEGVEETAVITLAAPPSGPLLYSGFGDLSGFAHDDLAVSPTTMFVHPTFANTTFLEFAELAPNVVFRSGYTRVPRGGDPNSIVTLALSRDAARTWRPIVLPAVTDASGISRRNDLRGNVPIAINADGTSLIVMTPTPLMSRDLGSTWTAVRGLPNNLRVVADRANPERLYALDFEQQRVYASTDAGEHFAAVNTSGLPTDAAGFAPKWIEAPWPLVAAPHTAGELWVFGPTSLWRSDDGGRSFREVKTSIRVEALSFGQAAPANSHPSLFAIGSRGDLRAIWRSDDEGHTWERLNDDRHEYGRRFRCIAGDRRVYGRVYVGTDGRGILVGEPNQERAPHRAEATPRR